MADVWMNVLFIQVYHCQSINIYSPYYILDHSSFSMSVLDSMSIV